MEELDDSQRFRWLLNHYLVMATCLTEGDYGYYSTASRLLQIPERTLIHFLQGNTKHLRLDEKKTQEIAKCLKMDPFAYGSFQRALNRKSSLPRVLSKSRRTDLEPDARLVAAGHFYYGEKSSPKFNIDELGDLPELIDEALWLGDFYCSVTVVDQALWAKFIDDTRRCSNRIYQEMANSFDRLGDLEWCEFIKDHGANFDPRPANWQADSPLQGQEKHPVVNINWHQAIMFAAWMSFISGRRWRLPYESQWEKAARGMDARLWPWGDDEPSRDWCNFTPEGRPNATKTIPANWEPGRDHDLVKAFVRSPYGMMHMAGNIWEFTNTSVGHQTTNVDDKKYAWKFDERESIRKGSLRIARGGSFLDHSAYIRCSYRTANNWTEKQPNRGFRLVCEPPDDH